MTGLHIAIARGVWLDLWAKLDRKPTVDEFARALSMSRRAAFRYLARFDPATKAGPSREVARSEPPRPSQPSRVVAPEPPRVFRLAYCPPAGSIALSLLHPKDRTWHR